MTEWNNTWLTEHTEEKNLVQEGFCMEKACKPYSEHLIRQKPKPTTTGLGGRQTKSQGTHFSPCPFSEMCGWLPSTAFSFDGLLPAFFTLALLPLSAAEDLNTTKTPVTHQVPVHFSLQNSQTFYTLWTSFFVCKIQSPHLIDYSPTHLYMYTLHYTVQMPKYCPSMVVIYISHGNKLSSKLLSENYLFFNLTEVKIHELSKASVEYLFFTDLHSLQNDRLFSSRYQRSSQPSKWQIVFFTLSKTFKAFKMTDRFLHTIKDLHSLQNARSFSSHHHRPSRTVGSLWLQSFSTNQKLLT